MRSLIRGHRRSDSSTSDLSSPIEQNLVKAPTKTNASPIVPCLPLHMTPPQAFSGSNQSAMSSPKKLLTPIKKMFGHHGKNGNLSATVDNLNSVVFGEFEPPKGRKPIGANSLTNLTELRNHPYPPHSPKIHGYRSLSLLEAPSQIKFEQLVNIQPPVLGHNTDSFSDSSQDLKKPRKLAVAIFDTRLEPETNESLLLESVISKPRTSTESESVLNKPQIIVTSKNDSETLYEADDDLRDSDASSQFSFVKDMVGGRNTSIKYYKTKSQMKKSQPRKDFLGMDDALDDEVVDSDYDFENNGLDDHDEYDYEDDGFEANDRFNDFLSDESATNLEPEITDFDLKPPKFALNCDSRSDSPQYDEGELCDSDIIKGSPINNLMSSLTNLRSPGYGDDFLDAYLDKSRLPLPITSHSLGLSIPTGVQEQKDVLPEENDQESKTDQESRSTLRAIQNRAPSYAESRKSITDMMGLLAALDLKPVPEENNPSASVSNIMGMLEKLEQHSGKNSSTGDPQTDAFLKVKETLSTLEKSAAATSPEVKAQMRRSIADMMNTLSILDDHLEKKTVSKKYQKQMSKKPFTATAKLQKRYSWCNDSEKIGVSSENYDENSSEMLNGSLDQDLIDEINLVPEDYDFDKQPELDSKLESGFYRSNSYNKKPERVIKDFKYQDNKIKTPLKTVTFYRGNSEHSLNVAPSRMGSNKSMTSFTSVDDQDFDLQFEAARNHLPLKHNLGNHNLHSVHVSSPLYFMSSDSISRRSENLEPIDESDIASI